MKTKLTKKKKYKNHLFSKKKKIKRKNTQLRRKKSKKTFKKIFVGGQGEDNELPSIKKEGKSEFKEPTKGEDIKASKEAIAVTSLADQKSNISDIPESFLQGISDQYGDEIQTLKLQFKDKLDQAAVIIKEMSNQSEQWNSPENAENIKKLKENTLKQIDEIGIPVASGAAKVAGSATGTVVKEAMMASGILEVITALKLGIVTLNTVIEMVNKLGITEKMAPLVQATLGKAIELISMFGNTANVNQNTFTAKIGDKVEKTVSSQDIEVTKLPSGEMSTVQLEEVDGKKSFEVKKPNISSLVPGKPDMKSMVSEKKSKF